MVQGYVPPQPDNFDHQIDQFYLWTVTRSPQWVERGVYSALALKGGKLLDLCCGDGFNARNFYSVKSTHVVACDIDPKIIRLAKRKNPARNVSYEVADIRWHMPDGRYENIIWDSAIEYFTEAEICTILESIKDHLTADGIVSGHTYVENMDEPDRISNHKYHFKCREDLVRMLMSVLENVLVFETEYPGRHNLYFWASDAVIPFGSGWAQARRIEKSSIRDMEHEMA